MKRIPKQPPEGLVAWEIEPGKVIFVHPLDESVDDPCLTAAEREIAALVLEGCDNPTIARIRRTAVRTTANQVASIFAKLGVRSRAELAARVFARPETRLTRRRSRARGPRG